MTSPLTKPQRTIRTRPFTSSDYAKLIETGILPEDERVELLFGEIIPMAPIGGRHLACLNRLIHLFSPLATARQAVISPQNPIHLDDYSEPQPDLVIARFRDDFYEDPIPAPPDILLLIEISDSTEDFDRREKLPLYAQAGILETWLVILNQNAVESYHTPSPDGYRDIHRYIGDERIFPQAIPDFPIVVSDLFRKESGQRIGNG